MEAERAESQLAILYSSSAVLSAVSIISLVVVWQHWAWTLDVCINVDCGCILYSVNTFNAFMGGDVKLCHFGTYGLFPALVIGVCLGIYHGYRSCIRRKLDRPKTVSLTASYNSRDQIHDGMVVVVGPKSRSPCKQWVSAAYLAAFVCCLSLAHAVVITDGYYKTCDQYRRNLIQLLGSRGREALAIHDRLTCGAILDYMDYVQPDANNWRRGDEINTGLALQFAIATSWFNFFAWICIIFVNSFMARRTRSDSEERFRCCC